MNIRYVVIGFILLSCLNAQAQNNVFQLFRKEINLADQYYKVKEYSAAFDLYSRLYKKDSTSRELSLKMARCAYQLKKHRIASRLFQKSDNKSRTAEDQFHMAESLAFEGREEEAINAYSECLRREPDQPIIAQKIWQLKNIQFLYEDSLHYAIRPLPLNTTAGEFCVVPYNDGILFISNRKAQKIVEKIDGSLNAPVYKIYFSRLLPNDASGSPQYKTAAIFNDDFYSGHAGSLSLYNKQQNMVFASTSETTGPEGTRTMQLYFASKEKGKWKITNAFAHNDPSYSMTDPWINEEGTVLYFSSNIKGGKGGKDIYRSFNIDGKWSVPENLGEQINTPYDEALPFMHQKKTLYFASNGHAGMGGMDIFKSESTEKGFGEVLNVGYPINSHADEFGITIDSLNSHGYFSSNRKRGGYDDDLFEVDIDLQTYPLKIEGWMGIKEHQLTDSAEIKTFAHAKFYLIDNLREVVVQEGNTDEAGNFTWIIPYFSKYRMRVIGPDKEEHSIIVDVPKQKQLHGKHEVVIIKDPFRSN